MLLENFGGDSCFGGHQSIFRSENETESLSFLNADVDLTSLREQAQPKSIDITGVMQYSLHMAIARSRLTAQGQISIPSEVRKRLGVGPGSVLEWEETDDDGMIVKRAARFSSTDIHREVFGETPKPKKLSEFRQGIRDRMRKRYEKR
jgi:AbrB family looped-hinge helix DNA binding protein